MKLQDMDNLTIDVKPHHLFRYPSEWDPRQNGKTKGGYLEGRIQLPKNSGNLRVLLSTYPETPHQFKAGFEEENPNSTNIHPTLIHVVRKGKGNRRFNDKEPVPNIQHWQQEFVIINKNVFIRNKTSDMDEPRYENIEKISAEDEMFPIQDDMVLPIGKESGELNMIILIPKTEKRASHEDVSLNKLLKSRIKDSDALKVLTDTYTGKNSLNLKKVKLRVDIFSLETNVLIGSSISSGIFDTASKAHGAMDLYDATPLRSCADGGRKIVMIAEFGLAKDVEPRFQLYDSDGVRLKDQEEKLLAQPNDQTGKSVSIMKETIVFITPKQPNAEMIMQNQWTVKLVARRSSDGLVSKTKFNFDIVPHDFYSTCIFCEIDPDKQALGHATIAPMRDVARPGLRKRQMSGTEVRDFSDKPENGTEDIFPSAHKKHRHSNSPEIISDSEFQEIKVVAEEKRIPSEQVIPSKQVMPSLSSLPNLGLPSHVPNSLPASTLLTLPSTIAHLNFSPASNGFRPSTLSTLPRIYPKPIESLTEKPVEPIKTESQDNGITKVARSSCTAIKKEDVPFHDLNHSQILRIIPVNMGGQSQDSSLIFPSVDAISTKLPFKP